MNFDEWLKIGIDNRWCLPPTCATHDGIPMNEEEQENDEYDDICITAMRICDPVDWASIYDNTPAMKWRDNR